MSLCCWKVKVVTITLPAYPPTLLYIESRQLWHTHAAFNIIEVAYYYSLIADQNWVWHASPPLKIFDRCAKLCFNLYLKKLAKLFMHDSLNLRAGKRLASVRASQIYILLFLRIYFKEARKLLSGLQQCCSWKSESKWIYVYLYIFHWRLKGRSFETETYWPMTEPS